MKFSTGFKTIRIDIKIEYQHSSNQIRMSNVVLGKTVRQGTQNSLV